MFVFDVTVKKLIHVGKAIGKIEFFGVHIMNNKRELYNIGRIPDSRTDEEFFNWNLQSSHRVSQG